MSRFGRDMVIYASADLLGSSIGLVLSPVFTRLFTPAQYGAQAALSAIWSFVCLAQYAGMDSAYPFFRVRTSDEHERRRVMVTATFLAVVSALIVSGGFAVVGLVSDVVVGFAGVSRRDVAAFVLTLAPGAWMAWFLTLMRFERRASAFARVSLLGRVVGALALVPALTFAAQEDRLALGFVITGAATLMAAGLGWRELARAGLTPWAPALFAPAEAKAMLRYGLVLVPAAALYAASTALDRLLVTWFAGPEETSVLALALRLGAVAVMLRTWFALVWDPQLMDWIATMPREQLVPRLNHAAGLIARVTVLIVTLAALWTGPVVTLLYPAAYAATIPLVPWIVFAAGVSALSLVAVATITIARQPRWCLPVYAVGLLANLAVGVWAVPRFGAAGAVAGVVSGEICVFVCWVLLGRQRLRNLPLAWTSRVALVATAAVFVAWYRPGFVVAEWPWAERIGLTAGIVAIVGVPLARQLWRNRGQFFGRSVAN